MAVPPHRARVIAVLTETGFRSREDHLPTRHTGGTFSAIGGKGVLVTADWWGVTDAERADPLARMETALRTAWRSTAASATCRIFRVVIDDAS